MRPEKRIIHPGDGLTLGADAGARDRFLADSKDWGGNVAVIEHLLAPHLIAAPVHRHSREDEFSFILEGKVWFQTGDEEHVAEVGDLVFKPRGEWHTFWNAAPEPSRVLEVISPGGLEEMFKIMGRATDEFDLSELAARYGCEVDLDATAPIVERYGLTWG